MKKKQLTAALLLLALAVGALVGCGKKKETITIKDGEWKNVYFNEEYIEEGMKTVRGNEAPEVTLNMEEYGFGLGIPDRWNDWEHVDELDDHLYLDYCGNALVFYIGKSETVQEFKEINEDLNASNEKKQEAYYKIFETGFPFVAITTRDAGSTEALFADSDYGNRFSSVEKVGTFGGKEYYFCYNEALPTEGYSETDLMLFQYVIDSMEELKENLVIFPAHAVDYEAQEQAAADKASAINLSSFQTADLNGNTVTQDIFKDYEVTMINIWGTGCGPCREEMPELQAAFEQLPENANIIGLCVDGEENGELAAAITEKTGVKFTQLVMSEQMLELVGQYTIYTPTTIFVDSQGNLIGEVLIGARSGVDLTEYYLENINALLK